MVHYEQYVPILPHVQVPHLASHVLGQLARRAAADWQYQWGVLVKPLHEDCRRLLGTEPLAGGREQ